MLGGCAVSCSENIDLSRKSDTGKHKFDEAAGRERPGQVAGRQLRSAEGIGVQKVLEVRKQGEVGSRIESKFISGNSTSYNKCGK